MSSSNPPADIPVYRAVLSAWRRRADASIRDPLWAAAAWAASADALARGHPAVPGTAHRIAGIEQSIIERLSEDPTLVLLVMNERIAMREQIAKAPASEHRLLEKAARARTLCETYR